MFIYNDDMMCNHMTVVYIGWTSDSILYTGKNSNNLIKEYRSNPSYLKGS